MTSFDMLVAITLAIAAVAVGLTNTAIWIRLARKVSDHNVQSKFLYFALTTLLLASSETVFVLRQSRGLSGGTFEYIQYGFIIAGFIAFMLSARLHLRVSEVYGKKFSTPSFGRIKARSAKRTADAAASKKRPKGKKKK